MSTPDPKGCASGPCSPVSPGSLTLSMLDPVVLTVRHCRLAVVFDASLILPSVF